MTKTTRSQNNLWTPSSFSCRFHFDPWRLVCRNLFLAAAAVPWGIFDVHSPHVIVGIIVAVTVVIIVAIIIFIVIIVIIISIVIIIIITSNIIIVDIIIVIIIFVIIIVVIIIVVVVALFNLRCPEVGLGIPDLTSGHLDRVA